MEVNTPLRSRYVLLRPVQAFLATELFALGPSLSTEEKVLKRGLHICLPSRYCQDTLVSFFLRNSFSPLKQSWTWSPCSRLCGFCGPFDAVVYCAIEFWLMFTPLFLLVLHTATKLSFFGLVSFHLLRRILADDFMLHLEVSGSTVGRNGYPDRFYSVKSFVAAVFLELLPRFPIFTLIVYGFSILY